MEETRRDSDVELQQSEWPLQLPRVVASVVASCPRCHVDSVRRLLLAVDWWDRNGLEQQRQLAQGLICERCGENIELPVPLVQRRTMDAVDLVVGLPASSSADSDRAWIGKIISAIKTYVSTPSVVTVRSEWWPHIDTVPLGPSLAGLLGPPDLPETLEERQRWLASTKALVEVPDIAQAVVRFVLAETVADARAVTEDEPYLLEQRWRTTVELAGSRLLAAQETDEQREVVEQRLSRLRQIAVNREPDAGSSQLPVEIQATIDNVVSLPESDPGRLAGFEAVVSQLRPLGPSRMLAAALTSLLAIRMADSSRSHNDSADLADLAEEAAEMSRAIFGDNHEATVVNTLNGLLVRQDRPDLSIDDRVAVCVAYEQLAADDAVRRSGHLVDILNNLAAAFDGRIDLTRTDRQERVLQLFEQTEHIARLVQPSDSRTIVLALVNQAAVLRQRIAGSRLRNTERAWQLLAEAQDLDASRAVLHSVERVQIAANRLNAAYQMHALGSRLVGAGDVLEAARDATRAASRLHDDNDIAIATQVNAGGILVNLYVGSVQADQPAPNLLAEAERMLEATRDRADRLYPPGHTMRLTAELNLASVYGAPGIPSGVVDADRCAELLNRVIGAAAHTSLDHVATAATNLGTLRVGQGDWDAAARAYADARQARARLIEQTSVRHARLGEVVATGDLAAREALAYARMGDPVRAIATLEDSRANLLRHRRGADVATVSPPPAGRAIAYLASCSFATFCIVLAADRPPRIVIGTMPSGAIREVLTPLVAGRTRMTRLLAFDRVAATLQGLVDSVSALVPADTNDLCVVACGPLSGAPLHAIPGRDGRTWTERWPVRYWPSRAVVAAVGEPDVGVIRTAVAIADPTLDLPLAATELDAVRSFVGQVDVPPDGWSVKAWVQYELPRAHLAHFACHARADLSDPTGSYFELGATERLSVDELLDGPDLEDLELVVASACQAGVPAVDAPDELLGIGYGLLHAGASASVTTLWDVNDVPASLLIASFYDALARGHHPAAALREAQLWLAGVDNRALSGLCAARLEQGSQDTAWLPYSTAEAIRTHVDSADPHDRPFHHAADWGAFTYLGG